MSSNTVEKKITNADLKQIFWRSLPYNASFNYERQLNMGWAYTLVPILKKILWWWQRRIDKCFK